MSNLADVITVFYSGAAVIGFLSVAGLICCSLFAVLQRGTTDGAYMSVTNPDAILLVLTGMTRVLQFLSRVFGRLGKVLVRAIAVCSLVGVVVAVTLFLTARGLHEQYAWARIAALVASACGSLFTGFAFVATRGLVRVTSLVLAAICGRVLWIVWQGYPF